MDNRAAVLAALSGALIGVAAYLIAHPIPPGQAYARAIATGEARARVLTPNDAEDDAISNGANEAGYRWAERNAIDNVSECPTEPAPYRTGCLDYVAESTGRR